MSTSPRHPDIEYRRQYRLRLEKSLTVTLLFFILLTLLSPRVQLKPRLPEPVEITLQVEDIPATRQGAPRRPPRRPAVPIPVESESIPPDATIEETELNLANKIGDISSAGRLTDGIGGGAQIIPPRPIALVLPEYPEEDKRKKVEGVVKVSLHIDETGRVIDAVVVENTTGSERCAAAALRAAKGTRFIPARRGGKPIPYWVTMPYTFSLPK